MFRAALREVRAALEDDREFGTHVIRAQPSGDRRRELRIGKFVVDRAHAVRHRLRRALEFAFRVFIAAFEEAEPAAFAQQVDGGLEGDELLQAGHVDAVAVRIPDRRRGRGDDDLLRIEPVEDRQDRVFERVAADDRVVQRHKRVGAGPDQPVSHIIDVHVELPAAGGVGDEGAEFRVLDRNLSEAHGMSRVAGDAVQRIQQPVEADLRGVRNVREQRVCEVTIHLFQHGRHELPPERPPLAVDLRIVRA